MLLTRARSRLAVLLAGATLFGLAPGAQAADPDWRLRVGPGRIAFDEQVRLAVGGAVVPGAGARLSDDTALLAEIGWRFGPHWSAGLTIGIPPTSTVTGTGSAAPFGEFGRVKYGPLGLTGQYQFHAGSALRPYLGAGVVYYMVFGDRDGSVAGLEVDNAWGTLVQAGVEYRLSPSVALFLDVKKLFLDTEARGSLPALGGAPVRADVQLDPLVIHAGISWSF